MSLTLFEIGAVARELGIAPSTLRSWERRYRIVVPQRGSNGQRLYDSDQILLLRQVLVQVRRGVRAGAAHQALDRPGNVRSSRLQLPATSEAPAAARRAVDALLADRADPRFAFHLRLVASELVKNAVVQGPPGERIEFELQLGAEWADLRVRNGSRRLRVRNLRTRPSESLGLEIVDAVAASWTIDSGPRGTSIAARLAVPAEAP